MPSFRRGGLSTEWQPATAATANPRNSTCAGTSVVAWSEIKLAIAAQSSENVVLWGMLEEADLALGVARQHLVSSKVFKKPVSESHPSVLFSV
jgi:hypothetical protein